MQLNNIRFISKETLSPDKVAYELGCEPSELKVDYNHVNHSDGSEYFFEKLSLRTEVYSIDTGERLQPDKAYLMGRDCVYLELSDSEGNTYSYLSHSQRDLLKQISDDNQIAASKHESVAKQFEDWKGFKKDSRSEEEYSTSTKNNLDNPDETVLGSKHTPTNDLYRNM